MPDVKSPSSPVRATEILPPLDSREQRKRKREWILIVSLACLFVILTLAEFRLSSLSSSLPFVNSIFFFGLLNVNIVILIALSWLVLRNIGKLFIERRRKILGARLKTKLVIAFLAFSITPTLVLFIISAMYINSSFDKWFSIKIQNTLQASLEITQTYYRNADQTAMHFAERIAKEIAHVTEPKTVSDYLDSQRELLALDGVEYYPGPLEERSLSQRAAIPDLYTSYPRLALDQLEKAFSGEHLSVIQHIGSGDLIRCMVPVIRLNSGTAVSGIVVVDTYIPVSLVNKVYEVASDFDEYKDINPLKYPMKTMYLVVLIMITLVILFVAIWIGFYMARELTVPVERLVYGAQAVGAGNLDVTISGSGHDEIAVLVESFNKMTKDLRDNRERLTKASGDLERRRLQLEAVLANVGTGVIVVEHSGEITTFNHSLSQLLDLNSKDALGKIYSVVLQGEALPLVGLIDRSLLALKKVEGAAPDVSQFNFKGNEQIKTLAAIASPLWENNQTSPWGVVVVVDDMTHLIKGQREMAWREVARRIAHEIKNPLTPIKLSAQRLQRRLGHYPGRDTELLKECTDTIIKHTDELKEMVNEFSNFARFPEVSPAPHDLNDALKEVLSLYQPAHPQITFRFEAESKLPIFEFDRDQIKRVIINLMDNAVAALGVSTQQSKIIRLETHYNEQLQMAVVGVGDNGPGMTEDVKARVFEPYFSTKTEGTGLGLAIAKRIINDHDGFIRVQSAPNEGTLFLIELPTSIRRTAGMQSDNIR